MEHVARITDLLGGAKALGGRPASDQDFVALLRRGLPVRSLQAVLRWLGLSDEEASASLGVPKRTLARRKAEGARLKSAESERVLRLARVATAAEEALGSLANAQKWLRTPNTGLGGEVPLSLLDTDLGTETVLDELRRFEAGVFS
jgi:putative toxin-antitoxin system antitoxin component (TIGR02293 family)